MIEHATVAERESPEEARNAARRSVFLGAQIATSNATIPATIRNISSSGALLSSIYILREGDVVILQRGSLSVAAEVVRREADKFAVRFAETLNEKLCRSWMDRASPSITLGF